MAFLPDAQIHYRITINLHGLHSFDRGQSAITNARVINAGTFYSREKDRRGGEDERYRVTPCLKMRGCEEAAARRRFPRRRRHTGPTLALRAHVRARVQLGYRISPARIPATRPPSPRHDAPDGIPENPPGDRPIVPRDARVDRGRHTHGRRRGQRHGEVPYGDARNRGTSVTGDDATSVRAREDGSGGGRKRERERSQTRGENGEDDRPIPAEVTVLT